MSKQYYILKPAVGTKETGMTYPPLESFEDYDFNSPKSVYKLNSDSFPDFIPDIRFKLAKGAKLCDVMGQGTISACGLLINEGVKEVLEQFNLIPHKYYPATIQDKGIIHKYYWVHCVWEDGIKHLDFSNSRFQINEFGDNLGDVELNSYQELLDKQTELGFMKMLYNYNSSMYNIDFELFTHPLNKTIYVSEKLFSSLTHKSFTGIDISVADNLLVR